MPLHESVLTIGGVAMEAGVNVETIRFYQRKGLLQEPRTKRAGWVAAALFLLVGIVAFSVRDFI